MYFIAYILLFLFKINTKYFKNSLLFKNSQKKMSFGLGRSTDRSTIAYYRSCQLSEWLTDPLARGACCADLSVDRSVDR